MRTSLFFILFIFLFSCSSDQGNKVIGDQLSVYYDSPQDERLAEEVANYWRDNGFLTGEKQDVRILNQKDKFKVLLIESESFKNDELPFNERKLLNDLKNDLQETIFHSTLELIICNQKFEPKYTLN